MESEGEGEVAAKNMDENEKNEIGKKKKKTQDYDAKVPRPGQNIVGRCSIVYNSTTFLVSSGCPRIFTCEITSTENQES